MPIRYRHFYLHKLSDLINKQNEEMNKKMDALNGTQQAQPTKSKGPKELPPIPDFAYKTKAPKK